MIAFIRGRVITKSSSYAVIETAGIGYQVFLGEALLNELPSGIEVEVYTHHQVREEASDLYGFKTVDDLELFELLLTVSGIGPKSALGILNLATAGDVREAIIRGDDGLLTKVTGIGKKTAQRLVLELKNKIVRVSGAPSASGRGPLGGGDELDALMSLGYSLSEARAALNQVEPEITDSGERVKAALRKMVRR